MNYLIILQSLIEITSVMRERFSNSPSVSMLIFFKKLTLDWFGIVVLKLFTSRYAMIEIMV